MGSNVASRAESTGDGVPYAVEPAACYVLAAKRPDTAYRLFNELTRNGVPGLVISRQHPARVQRVHGVTCRVVWLCHTLGEDCLNPAALQSLYERITVFLCENPDGVALVDGLEYLAGHNEFRRTLTFVEDLNEFVSQHGSVVLFPVDPDALTEREFALLGRELEVRDSADIRTDLDVRDVARLLEPS